jgi:hypothetical protein
MLIGEVMLTFRQLHKLVIPPAPVLAVVAIAWAEVSIGGSSFAVSGQPNREHQYAGACRWT